MVPSQRGRRIALSPARRMVHELMIHAQRIPSIPLSAVHNVKSLCEMRSQLANPPSWIALYMKAFAMVARDHPVLRRLYLPYPTAHLYEHPCSIAVALIEREVDGEPAVLAAKFRAPENQPLEALDATLTRYRSEPVESISDFRQTLRLGRLPGMFRRFVFWSTLNFSGFKRSKRFGTFMVSSLGMLGVEQEHPITTHTADLTLGPIQPDGSIRIRVIYDHRVTDGKPIARAMKDLSAAMNGPILAELRSSSQKAA